MSKEVTKSCLNIYSFLMETLLVLTNFTIGRERYRYDSDSSSYSDTIKRGSKATDSILSSYGNYSWDSLKSANSDLLNQTLDNLLKDL